MADNSCTINSGLRLTFNAETAKMLAIEEQFVPDLLQSCLEEHRRILSEDTGSILKNAHESAVTLVEVSDSGKLCVKEFRWRGWLHALKSLFRSTQGSRTYSNGCRLKEAGIGVATPLALATRKKFGLIHTQWIIMEVIPGASEMDRFIVSRISDWSIDEKRGMALLFGRFIGSLHGTGIFHSDLKTCNIMVSNEASAHTGGALKFYLLDYDDVLFRNPVSRKKRIKNLSQLFLSIPLAIRAPQRLRFLREYALHSAISGKERRSLAKEVLAKCTGKDILYVGLSGDIREKWS
jgi:tRNA A-37 threonylcarbamoyl transferase component Bud32